MKTIKNFLPTTRDEMLARGWDGLDIILISGDAYVDHPSYGISLIGRVLESKGFRVGIIAQPDWRNCKDFTRLGAPRLLFGISGGNVDSMIANYTANKRVRQTDDYSPGGRAGMRPDRAVIVYANRVREAFGGEIPIIIGGIEASLRRLAHYDYWDDAVRRSILADSRASLLVYGMGERQIAELAGRLHAGETINRIRNVRGTAYISSVPPEETDYFELPSYETVSENPEAFNDAFMQVHARMSPHTGMVVVQPHAGRYVVVNPPAMPLTEKELDDLYLLPFARAWHPGYDASGGIKGYETVRFSVTAHRGCCGECSFCAIYFHQGRIVQSRSHASILREITSMTQRPEFKGTITDIGGPTANLYAAECTKWKDNAFCTGRSCLTPQPCSSLKMGYERCMALYARVLKIPSVKHVFLGSGLRFDLLVQQSAQQYLQSICRHHISGLLKVAPEHCSDVVLDLMNKPRFQVYERFVDIFKKTAAAVGKKIFIVNYFIAAHPGSTLEETHKLARYLAQRGMKPEQIQDFIPSPMTRSTCMYHTGRDPYTGKQVSVARTFHERKMHRALIQYDQPANKRLLREALQIIGVENIAPETDGKKRVPSGKSRKASAKSGSVLKKTDRKKYNRGF